MSLKVILDILIVLIVLRYSKVTKAFFQKSGEHPQPLPLPVPVPTALLIIAIALRRKSTKASAVPLLVLKPSC